jgi:NitT/TauT family transport system substrate-binding protein
MFPWQPQRRRRLSQDRAHQRGRERAWCELPANGWPRRCSAAWTTSRPRSKANGGKPPVIFNYADYGVYQPATPSSPHRTWSKTIRDLVKRFVKGTLMAEGSESQSGRVDPVADQLGRQHLRRQEKKQAREVLDVTLSILYSPNNKDKRLGLNVAADWAGRAGHAAEVHGPQDRHEGRRLLYHDFVPESV